MPAQGRRARHSGSSAAQASITWPACWRGSKSAISAWRISPRRASTPPIRRGACSKKRSRPGRSRDALAKLETACGATSGAAGRQQAWREFAEYFNGTWGTRRDALEVLLASNARAGDWRTLGGIDADSILEERRRYALVAAQLPPGVTLGTATDHS